MAATQNQISNITIHRRNVQNQCFDEKLGDGLLLRMMQIPGGSFTMGSPEEELDRQEWEGPQHRVTVSTFFMGKYPITRAQWRFVAGLGSIQRDLPLAQSEFEDDRHPVEGVSWYDAVEFCERLSRHTSRAYRLPTEVEWEYACRAETTTPFHFGETISTELANYNGTDEQYGAYGNGIRGKYRQQTTPVDYFNVANAWGLCDMHGNVWEWCQDHWHSNYEGAPEDGRAWLSDNNEAHRVIRGGSWLYNPRDCRSASRYYINPVDRSDPVGFRVVCIAPRALQT